MADKIRQSHSATLRYARVRAYRLVQKLEREFLKEEGGYIPEELSVRESYKVWDDESQTGKTTITFRFSGGTKVRLEVALWYDDHYQMVFRSVTSASLNFKSPKVWGEKDQINLGAEYFYDRWGDLPSSVCETVEEILSGFALKPTSDSLKSLVEKIRDTGHDIQFSNIQQRPEIRAWLDEWGLVNFTLTTSEKIIEKAIMAYFSD